MINILDPRAMKTLIVLIEVDTMKTIPCLSGSWIDSKHYLLQVEAGFLIKSRGGATSEGKRPTALCNVTVNKALFSVTKII